jgi:hypothetical protein
MLPVFHDGQWKPFPSNDLRRTAPVKDVVESLR